MSATNPSAPPPDPTTAAAERPDALTWGERIVGHVPALSLLVLCIAFTLSTDTFFTLRNLLNVLDQLTVLGIMALGMTAVIVIGGIDLSVGSVLALSMMVMGWLANVMGLPMPMAMSPPWR
jgi:ribose transport system permease protein